MLFPYFHGWSIIFLVILRLKNDLIDWGQWLFNSFAMIQSHPCRYDQVFILRTFVSSFFLTQNKRPNQCFTVGHRTRNSLETQKSSTEKLWLVIHLRYNHWRHWSVTRIVNCYLTWGLKSTFINITGARYQRSYQGGWKLRMWSWPVKSSAFFQLSVLTY